MMPIRMELITAVTHFAREKGYERQFSAKADWLLDCGEEDDLEKVERSLERWLKKNGWDFRKSDAEVILDLKSTHNEKKIVVIAGKKEEKIDEDED